MQGLAKKRNVAAVVLRADLRDALPSDLVAEGTRKLKEAGKPVIVSQGSVAASGGYWISMDGTRILTTPLTVTGSIGVISGWLWDTGVGEKTGFLGRRGRGPPFGSLHRDPVPDARTAPTRNMTDEERTVSTTSSWSAAAGSSARWRPDAA
jgi:protease-4